MLVRATTGGGAARVIGSAPAKRKAVVSLLMSPKGEFEDIRATSRKSFQISNHLSIHFGGVILIITLLCNLSEKPQNSCERLERKDLLKAFEGFGANDSDAQHVAASKATCPALNPEGL